ncbi:MAG: hypothetical protein OEY33_07620, partial [Bdellovibrionales bacterium]|nr:hypothetical protein [Bdellovibrionales bacterium]
VIAETSGNDAINRLEKEQDFLLILCDQHMENGNGEDVFKFHSENKINTPLFLVTGDDIKDILNSDIFSKIKLDRKPYGLISKPFSKKDIIKALKKVDIYAKEEPYKKVNIKLYYKYCAEILTTFIKLSSDKYVKIIEENEEDYHNIIDKYIQKGIKYIYLEEECFSRFMIATQNKLAKSFETNEQGDIDLSIEAIEVVHETIKILGVTKESKKFVNNTAEELIKIEKAKPEISKFVNKLLLKENYIYELAVLTSTIANKLCKETEWNSPAVHKKLTNAALLCDISLDNDEMAKLLTEKDIQDSAFNDKQSIIDHPQRSVEMISGIFDKENDCSELILQHHCIPEKGFPNDIKTLHINSLSCLFILSHYMANKILSENQINKNNLKKTIFEAESIFKDGNFKKITPILRKLFF